MAISTDSWDDLLFREEQRSQGMIYLSDTHLEVIDRYGLSDATLGQEVARPASFLLDGNGIVQWRHLPTDWRIRLDGDAYLEAYYQLLNTQEASP